VQGHDRRDTIRATHLRRLPHARAPRCYCGLTGEKKRMGDAACSEFTEKGLGYKIDPDDPRLSRHKEGAGFPAPPLASQEF